MPRLLRPELADILAEIREPDEWDPNSMLEQNWCASHGANLCKFCPAHQLMTCECFYVHIEEDDEAAH